MRIPKVYGKSQLSSCPFCNRTATHKTESGLVVCYLHTKEQLEEIKCTCGGWLEQRSGKFGPYFNCLKCGNMNFNKAMEIKAITSKKDSSSLEKKEVKAPIIEKKETIITSRDVEYFD